MLISTYQDYDEIEIQINRYYYFVTQNGEALKKQEKMKEKIPPQIDAGDAAVLESVGDVMNSAVAGFSCGSIVLNIFMASSLQLLWKMLGAI